ncbi:hypothetical protein PGT21_003860 [Puccinia graminis f. sp. tritici]|uniref:Uncharacterized protein n=1 Tax=Puccinia graminis f. sp. tritici TaxID=56615 RepID=A0A5B0MMV2_PUCGR|nr:hypothetical protein PGT21_003860 [Puccinia graminis f. sp. tritici]
MDFAAQAGFADTQSQESCLGPSQSLGARYTPGVFRFNSQGGAAQSGYHHWTDTQQSQHGGDQAGFLLSAKQLHSQPKSQMTQPIAPEGRLVVVDYILFIESAETEIAQNIGGRRAPSGPLKKQCDKLIPTGNSLASWRTDVGSHTWEEFKRRIVYLLSIPCPLFVQMLAQELENNSFKWQLILSGSRVFGPKKFYYASGDQDLYEFAAAIHDNPKAAVTVKLVMDDPQAKAKQLALAKNTQDSLTLKFGKEEERKALELELVATHPDIRADADIRLLFQAKWPSASASAPASRYPSAAAGIRAAVEYPDSWKEILPVDEVHVPRRPEGFPSSRPARYMYPTGWKGFLPVDEVHVPRQPEGFPFSRPARYMYPAGWKGFLPVDEVHVPRRLEGFPSSCRGTCTSPAGRKPFQPAICPSGLGYPLRYPGIRWKISGKGTSAPEPASAGGYPLQRAGIRQRITDIQTSSSWNCKRLV